MASTIPIESVPAKGTDSDIAHPETIPIQAAQVEPSDVSAARVVNRIVGGEDVEQADLAKLPTAPTDWRGFAKTIRTKPATKREKARDHYIANSADGARLDTAMRIARQEPDEPPELLPEQPSFILSIMDADELDEREFLTEWIVEGVFVADQPGVVGAAKKGLKTSTMIDFAVSVASGTAFLGTFGVPKAMPVLMLSGESGGFATKMTARRVCESRGFRLRDLKGRFFTGLELPKLNAEDQIAALAGFIRDRGIKVVIIDPLYLCLISAGAGGKAIDPKNLFEVGPLLQSVSRACLDAGATPILVHHNKLTGADPYGVPDLSNLSFAGIQEFARQWILLGRRERYVPGTGLHKLWLAVGGSVGHSGEWAVDVDEGVMDQKFEGRKWDVQVHTAAELRQEDQEVKESKKRAAKQEKEIDQAAEARDDEAKILDAVRRLGGSATRSKAYGAAPLRADRGNPAITRLVADGRLVETMVPVKKGKGETKEWGIGLAEPQHTPANPGEPQFP